MRSKSNKAELKNELSEDIKKELNVIDKERRDYELLIDEKIKNMMKSV
ncbi:MAG: hypothetical protein H6766_03220 [Candidatus Peribacteria bacterium]|nr:MAG: hypothetical protein H6766_03220 [Candidatus Peribacteria bacterium]